MSLLRKWLEIAVFLAVALAIHLLSFAVKGPAGATVSGAGGPSTVTLSGANSDLAALIEEWDESPEIASPPDVVEASDAMEAPEVDLGTEIAARIDVADPPEMVEIAYAPPIEETLFRPVEIAPAPAIETRPIMEAPRIETALTPRSTLAAPLVLKAQNPQAAPEIQNDSPKPLGKTPPAPRAAPPPQAKPDPPAKPSQLAKVSDAKSEKEPKRDPIPQIAAATPQPAFAQKENPTVGAASIPSLASGTDQAPEAGAGSSDASENSGVDIAALKKMWGKRIWRRIESGKKPPRNLRGSFLVEVSLTVGRAGDLVSAYVRTSSGSDRMDRAALKAVRSSAPYPAAPEDVTSAETIFNLPIRFKQ